MKKGKKSTSKNLKKEIRLEKTINNSKTKRDWKIIGVVSFVFLLLMAILFYSRFSAATVKVGDKISVQYIGMYENFSVFDTNIKEVAKASGIYNEKRGYSDLKFRAGKGQMIAGFDEAVIGMSVLEEKTVLIPAEKAYGAYQPGKTLIINRRKEIPINERTTRDVVIKPADLIGTFNVSTIKVNDTLPATEKYIWPIQVIKVEDKDLIGRLQPKVGDMYSEGVFNFTITKVTETEMTIKKTPQYDVLPSKFGQLIVNVEKDKIVSYYNVTIGEKVTVDNLLYYIASANETDILLDQNGPLAGKNLIFNITVLAIEK